MWIGAYVCLTTILVVPGLLLLSGPAHRRVTYLLLSFLLSAGVLVLYSGASLLTGLMRFGVASDYSYPQDYLEHGPLGWVIMVLLPLGVLSPILLALWLYRKGRPK